MNKLFFSLVIFVIILLVYQDSDENSFHLDDYQNILHTEAIHVDKLSLASLHNAIAGARLKSRIIPNLSFAFDWWRGGGKPAQFLQTNVIIHALSAVILFHLLLLVFEKKISSQRRLFVTAFLLTIIWAVHPIQVQSVSYIVQRMTSLSALFVISALYCYLRARKEQTAGLRYLWYTLVALCGLCGVISKENAWIVLILLLMAEYGVVRDNARLLSRPADKYLLLLPVLLLLYLVLDLATASGPVYEHFIGGYEARDFTMAERLLMQPQVILFYLSQYLWPMPWRFSIEHDFTVPADIYTNIYIWLSVAVLALWIAASFACAFSRKYRLTGFFMLWVPVTLFIESSFIALEMAYEHRMYLPSVGIIGVIGAVFSKLPLPTKRSTFLLPVISIVIATSLAVITFNRVKVWRTPLSLYVDALNTSPESPRLWGNIGRHLIINGEKIKGLEAMEKGLSYKPYYIPLLLNYAEIESTEGRKRHALELVNRAISTNPKLPKPYVIRGKIYASIANFDLALTDYDHAIRIDPKSATTYAYRGILLFKLGRSSSAIEDFTQAISIDPNSGSHYWNLGSARESMGQRSEAIDNYKIACKLSIKPACIKLTNLFR